LQFFSLPQFFLQDAPPHRKGVAAVPVKREWSVIEKEKTNCRYEQDEPRPACHAQSGNDESPGH
jgi:hypothetical protein